MYVVAIVVASVFGDIFVVSLSDSLFVALLSSCAKQRSINNFIIVWFCCFFDAAASRWFRQHS